MSEITGAAKVHEAYAFACMRCGHGWEQSYEIEHHVDAVGRQYVVYKASGVRVPSPLSSPTCANCGGHVVRIMRAGQVSSVLDLMARSSRPARQKKPASRKTAPPPTVTAGEGESASEGERDTPAEPHHWHLSDLLHPFHRR
ncbi:hypothetical protein ACWEFL_29425 [Streptomyces sp. NPDC004838]